MSDGKEPTGAHTLGGDHDLRALRAADRYLDIVAAGITPTGDDDISSDLTELFTAWRHDIGATPLPETPTVESLLGSLGDSTAQNYKPVQDYEPAQNYESVQPAELGALSAVVGAHDAADNAVPETLVGDGDATSEKTELAPENVIDMKTRRRLVWRREAVRALSAAAAFLVIAAGGLTVAIQSAGLNDPLWSVNQALFTKNANDIELATYLSRDIERARVLAASGKTEEADRVLDRVQRRIDSIGTDFRRNDVKKKLEHARKVVNGEDPEAAAEDKRKLKEEAASDSAAASASSSSSSAATETSEPSTKDSTTESTEPSSDSSTKDSATSSPKSSTATGSTSPSSSAKSSSSKSSATQSSATKSPSTKSSVESSSRDKTTGSSSSSGKKSTSNTGGSSSADAESSGTSQSARATTSVEPTLDVPSEAVETARQTINNSQIMETRESTR